MLEAGSFERRLEVPLGPEIGQCCGGYVAIAMDFLDAAALGAEEARHAAERGTLPSVYIFGAGHVGRALADSFSLLPVQITLVDEREEELALCRAPVRQCLTPLPEAEVRAAPAGSAFIVLTHDHALDFLLTAAALERGDAAYVGMIGSKASLVRALVPQKQRAGGTDGAADLSDRRTGKRRQAAGSDRRLRYR